MKYLFFLAIPLLLFADVTNGTQSSNLLQIFLDASTTWNNAIIPIATKMFWLLFAIGLSLSLIFNFFDNGGFEAVGVMILLLKQIMIVGIFMAFFQHPEWLKTIPQSFGMATLFGTNHLNLFIDVSS